MLGGSFRFALTVTHRDVGGEEPKRSLKALWSHTILNILITL
jgi:hypothetical protein